jgi:hypothetical protein
LSHVRVGSFATFLAHFRQVRYSSDTVVIASEAKQSRVTCTGLWIASSPFGLLAMTFSLHQAELITL